MQSKRVLTVHAVSKVESQGIGAALASVSHSSCPPATAVHAPQYEGLQQLTAWTGQHSSRVDTAAVRGGERLLLNISCTSAGEVQRLQGHMLAAGIDLCAR